jgi:uncharacterized membrane protein YciS (DUF1049 family)
MSQQINLFNPLFRKQGFSFTSATAMLYGVGIAVAAGATGAVYSHYQLREAGAQAQAVEQEHKATLARFEKLTAEARQLKPNAQLEADVARLDAQLRGRQEIIETLKSGAVGNTGGFSEYMRAFSRQTVNGLWLTGFDVARGGNELAIQGRTLNADLVAAYLKQLDREKPLQGRQFAALRIGQPPTAPAAPPKVGAQSAAGSAAQGQPDAKEPKPVAPRYLEFAVSTIDLPADSKQAATSTSGQAPLLGAIDTNSLLDTRNAAIRQEAPR